MRSDLPRRILILLHARDRLAKRRAYQIWGIADVWRSWGIEVLVQRGIDRFVDADVIVNHLDLTIVPPLYLRHMERYAVAINGRSRDISKRIVSRNLVHRNQRWDGPVILKTDRNYGGEPERRLLLPNRARVRDALRRRLSRHPWRIRQSLPSSDYLILDSVSAVPEDVWDNPYLVVERFLPEREGALYVLRTLTFFGDRWICRRITSASPVVKSGNAVHAGEIEPHPEAFATARRFGLDRGKVDYVLHDGEAVILDVNRTNTMGRSMTRERQRRTFERLAPGLRSFWPPGRPSPRDDARR